MTIPRNVHPFLILLAGAPSAACVPITSYQGLTVSAPASIPPGWSGEIDRNGRTVLRLDEIDLRVDARNATGKQTTLILSPFFIDGGSTRLGQDAPLVIFLELHPKSTGFSFDPMAVGLNRYRDVVVTPREFIGPGQSTGDRCLDSTGRELEVKTAPESHEILPGTAATCFVLAYAYSATAVRFRLLLGGLSSRGEPVELPVLQFKQRRIEKPLWTPPAFQKRRSEGQGANPR